MAPKRNKNRVVLGFAQWLGQRPKGPQNWKKKTGLEKVKRP